MAQRDGAAVDVDDLLADAQDLRRVNGNPGERLVYLHEIEVIGAPPGLLERELPGVARHGQEARRLFGDLGVGNNGS